MFLLSRLLVLTLLLCAASAHAHDPSAWGGSFRTRDHGLNWLPADAGLFIGGALDLAISPVDSNLLLYGTDTRLLRSRNGGRDWTQEAPGIFFGPVLAVAFLADGKRAVASTSAGLYRTQDGVAWSAVDLPQAAIPVRRILPGAKPDEVFLAGARGIYASRDGGSSFQRVGNDVLPDAAANALVLGGEGGTTVYAVIEGQVWASPDGGASWQQRGSGLPAGRVETLARDAREPLRLWAAGADHLYLSRDGGKAWEAHGQALPEAGTAIRGLAVDAAGKLIVLATPRGALRSSDAGLTWTMIEGTLPVHLEAGPLIRDPADPSTLYIGFSLLPYQEVWRRAEQGSNLLAQVDPYSLAGAAAFLVLLAIAAAFLVRFLVRTYRRDGMT